MEEAVSGMSFMNTLNRMGPVGYEKLQVSSQIYGNPK